MLEAAAAVRLLKPSLGSSSPVVKAVRACLLSPPHPPVEQEPQNLQGGIPVHPSHLCPHSLACLRATFTLTQNTKHKNTNRNLCI